MGLGIRMILYFVSAAAAGTGLIDFNPDTGDIIINIRSLEAVLGGGSGFLATFVSSRWAKSRGGMT
jgi:hypothetical protein